ncbi:MAG: hypothetical protein KC731_10320 [Myxococcales bacterium]|nr:hypothetical protein [Myxococcales bacterium]
MRRAAPLAMLLALACESASTDGTDLHGVYDKSTAPTASASAAPTPSAKPSASAEVRPTPRERAPVAGTCIADSGEAAQPGERFGKRPGCRGARVFERRDANGAPRYGCVYEAPEIEEREPLPLVVFLHGPFDDAAAVNDKTRLRALYHKLDLTGDPKHPGFIILSVQARKLAGSPSLRWDVDHHSRDNLDVVTIDHFVDDLLAEGRVDARQIYAIGQGRGGVMANLYAMLRPDRVAGFGAYAADASSLAWSCDAPPTPGAILYRACDTITPCADVERWLAVRSEQHAPTFSLRLDGVNGVEPSCALSKSACREKRGTANHHRWPAKRERDLLEYLGQYSLAIEAP